MKRNIGFLFVLLLIGLLFTSCSRDAPLIVTPPPPPPVQHIFLNEVYSRGTATDPDWVELYNNSADSIDLGGYKIYDTGGQSGSKPKKELPAGTFIHANNYLVIVTDDTTASGFGLGSGGETIWLEDNTSAVIDSVAFPAMEVTQSYGRSYDGGTPWKLLDTVTRGTSNSGGAVTILPIMMNEIYSRGTPQVDPDWIEIYNPSTVAIDVSGYKIYDSGGNTGAKPKKEFPAGTVVPARGYYVIVTDDIVPVESSFGLSSGGEEVWLEDGTGAVIDDVKFPAFDVTQSYSRIPNGSATWQISNTITRGAENQP